MKKFLVGVLVAVLLVIGALVVIKPSLDEAVSRSVDGVSAVIDRSGPFEGKKAPAGIRGKAGK